MRHRTRGAINNLISNYGSLGYSTYFSKSGPEPAFPAVQLNQSMPLVRSDLESCQDIVTPGYFKKLRAGEALPVNECYMTKHSANIVDRTYRARAWYYEDYGDLRYRVSREAVCDSIGISQDATVALVPPPADAGEALVEALAMARDELWDVGTTAAEMGKTVSLVTDLNRRSFGRMDRILSDMVNRRRRFRTNVAQLTAEFNSLWLSARYGWRPLAYDFQNAYDAIDRAYNGWEQRTRKYAEVESNATSTGPWVPWLGTNLVSYRIKHVAKEVARGFVGTRFSSASPAYIDPIATGWELIPFSFVADWFVNIGSNLKAFSPFAAGKLEWAGVSSEIVVESSVEFKTDWPQATHWELDIPDGASWSVTNYSRVKREPTLDFGVHLKMDSFKVVDLIALTSSALLRRANTLRKIAGFTSNRPKGP